MGNSNDNDIRPKQQTPDLLLIEETLAGDLQKFDTLIKRYRNNIYWYTLKSIGEPDQAEDLTQDTFLAAYQKLSTFQKNSKFLTWLIGIAHNKIRNYFNRSPEKRYKFLPDEFLTNFQSKEATPLEVLEKNSSIMALNQCIEKLPIELREIINLVSLEEFSYEEAAQIIQIPIGTVKSKLFRARKILKIELKSLKAGQ